MPGKSTRRDKGTENTWNLEELQSLIDLLEKREISEFEMEKAGMRIRIRRGNSRVEGYAPVFAADAAVSLPPRAPRPAPPAEAGEAVAPTEHTVAGESTEGLYIVKSPIVGTFYASPAPNAPPFVKLGDHVDVGQVLCIIEAMKLMNEIESEVAGEIVRVYLENGQPVEYGQSLFAIKPSHKK